MFIFFFFFKAEDGIRDRVRSRGLGDVYKRQIMGGTSEPVRESFLIEEPTLRHGARADGSDRDVSLRLQEGLDRAIVRGLVLRLLDETLSLIHI